jgi:ribose transport system permease protein
MASEPTSGGERRALVERPAALGPILVGARSLLRLQEAGVLGALLLMCAGLTLASPHFLTPNNLVVVLQQASNFGIMALGMVLVLSEGDIDLSVGSVLTLTNVIGAQLLANTSINPWLAGIIALAAGAACGFVNGALSILLRIPTFVVTLGTLSAYSGLALVIANGQSVDITTTDSSFFTIAGGSVTVGNVAVPATVIVMLVLCVIATLLYNRTPFGRRVCAVGSNRQAARFAGIRIERLRLVVMTIMGFLSGLSGVLTLAYLQYGGPTYGQGFELSVIASAIVGGTALVGGSGTMPGAVLGSLIIAVITNGLLLLGVNQFWSVFASGAVIIVAVAVDYLIKRR